MSLITIYGINAAGKDTAANALRNRDDEILVTSESRLLMYHLGFIDHFDTQRPVAKEVYRRLEDTPQPEILNLIDTAYRHHLEGLRGKSGVTLLLSHLVFALNIDKDSPIYLVKEIPEWIPQIIDGFLQLISHPEAILARRRKEQVQGVRDRGEIELAEIMRHQQLCDQKWIELTTGLDPIRYKTILNGELNRTVEEASGFLERFR